MGAEIEVLVLPPTNPVAEFKGGEQLQPEESTNFSIGTVIATGAMDLTIDYFKINFGGDPQRQDIEAFMLAFDSDLAPSPASRSPSKGRVAKGRARNNFRFSPPIHPAWRRCENLTYGPHVRRSNTARGKKGRAPET